mmetsp:Transcript_44724/g.101264  ORF Transcript_44724/g.101264 Transcript_44724/m.101264 type:complete len:137 (-) Transcript_44724:117-527(-)
MSSQRLISHEELAECANKLGVDFYETSAKTADGIEGAFRDMISDVLDLNLFPKKILAINGSSGEAGQAVTCTNLAGDEVAKLTLVEGTTLSAFLNSLSQHLQTPKRNLGLVLPTAQCLSREQHQMQLAALLGMDKV